MKQPILVPMKTNYIGMAGIGLYLVALFVFVFGVTTLLQSDRTLFDLVLFGAFVTATSFIMKLSDKLVDKYHAKIKAHDEYVSQQS